MTRLRTPAALLLAGTLTFAVSACGSDSGDDSGSTTQSTPTSESTPTGNASPSSSGQPSNGGIVPDEAWAQVVKKSLAPLDKKTDEEVVSAAEDVCGDFTANPVKEETTTILEGLNPSLGLDRTQAQVFATAAITHFCTEQSDAWTKAALD